MATLTPDKINVGTSVSVAGTEIVNQAGDGTFADLSLSGSAVITGDLTVNGTTTTINTELQTADRYLLLNSNYTADTALSGGMVMNVDPSAASFSISDITSDVVTVTAGDLSGLSVSDFVLIQGPATAANAGIFEILSVSVTGLTITIDSTPVEAFAGTGLTDDVTAQGTIVGVTVAVIRSTGTGVFQTGFGASPSTLAYTAFGGASGAFSFLNVGSSTVSAIADGDFASGDGTRELFFDASASRFSVVGGAAHMRVGASTSAVALGDLSVGDGTTDMLFDASASRLSVTGGAAHVRVGSSTSAVALGDLSAGDGTRDLLYDASTGVLAGSGAAFSVGTSDANSLSFITSGIARWTIDTSGHLLAGADDTYDIGADGATRPRTIYVGTSIEIGELGGTSEFQLLTVTETEGKISDIVAAAESHLRLVAGNALAASAADGGDLRLYSGDGDGAGFSGDIEFYIGGRTFEGNENLVAKFNDDGDFLIYDVFGGTGSGTAGAVLFKFNDGGGVRIGRNQKFGLEGDLACGNDGSITGTATGLFLFDASNQQVEMRNTLDNCMIEFDADSTGVNGVEVAVYDAGGIRGLSLGTSTGGGTAILKAEDAADRGTNGVLPFVIRGGDSAGTNVGGALTIRGGAALGSVDAGGVSVSGGNASGAGGGGALTLAGGTGTIDGIIDLQTAGISRWQIGIDGDLLPTIGTYDIGVTGTRVQTVYVGTSVLVGALTITPTTIDSSGAITIGGTSATALTLGRTSVGISAPGWLEVGSATSGVADGDFASGDGTRELFYDASAGRLALTGGASHLRVGSSTSAVALGDVSFGDGTSELSWDTSAASLTSTGANGQAWDIQFATTEVTAMSGATVTAASLIPAGSMVLGVSTRVTTLVTGATTFDVGDGDDVDRWGATIAVAATTTSDPTDFTDNTLVWQTSAAGDIVLTANGSSFTAGAVRITVAYISLTAPTS